ncbi:transglutaminase domain-containing protein [Sandaracinus amylolyticus]|uniref:transglutaminase domain-containing protein n=1 Tax=Sandaracinus amylolyticus TaxID=927083 RepID=UPI001F44DC9A|nr:transglutaminase domain-containing protein [Sandaracinus amylolyticus]
MRRLRPLTLAALVMLGATLARADDPIAHEYVPGVEADEGTMLVSSGGAAPEALVYDGEVIPAPEGGPMRPGEERAMQAAPGDERATEEVGRRSPSFRPDRVTELNGQVGYFEVFTPTISPFKRVTALDGITLTDRTPVLAIADRGPRREVPVEGAQAQAPDWRPRDLFWGSVVLDFSGGREVPFPSVSPESRLLTVRTEPETRLRFERDGADNFYAIVDEPRGAVSEVRVVFLTDAPRTYFGTELPRTRADALIAEVPQVPASVQRRGEEFAARLNLHRGMPFDVTLSELVRWFRDFEESAEPPRDTGDIYWDLANGQRGVCRHRAYGFVITAQALGIHARFVQNEAHAWVEVHLPENRGWLRIDLGGSPRGLSPHNTDERPRYRPEVPDPLPRPDAYVRAYQEAARLSEDASSSSSGGDEGSSSSGAEGATSTGRGSGGPPQGGAVQAQVEEGTAGRESRAALDLRLDLPSTIEVLRGRTLEVTGTARSADLGIAGLRIEVLLASESSAVERMLGVTVTNEHGAFRGSFGVPPDLAVGDYRLVVRSPGNAQVGPAVAR